MVIGCVWVTDVRVIDTIRRYRNHEKVWKWTTGAQRKAQEKDFELILTEKCKLDIP